MLLKWLRGSCDLIREAISKIVEGQDLEVSESRQVFEEIMSGQATESQIASFITALRFKGESVNEIFGAVEVMRSKVSKVDYFGDKDLLDVVGTGGDGKSSFNVSTASAIVAAGAGCMVAKHGNRSASSKSGSADVLEALGVKVDTSPQRNSEILSKIGFVFMFAPLHHPAMRFAVKPRKEIGIRTIFNIVGPLTNPAFANTYLLGAYNEGVAEKLANVLCKVGVKRAFVVSGQGYDEVTLTGESIVFKVSDGVVKKLVFVPEDFGFKRVNSDSEFAVNSVEESALIVKKIVEGKIVGPKLDLVKLNAGFAICASGVAKSFEEGFALAEESIFSGSALKKLELLVEESNK